MEMKRYKDLFLRSNLAKIDPDIDFLIKQEEKRQREKIILIPSESIAPKAVRKALGSVFTNLYAEGYPALSMSREEERLFLDFKHQLGIYRRYANRRFYKGTENVDFLEILAAKRIVQCFATKEVEAKDIFVNIQPLSGAAANNVVYQAMLEPGDTVMGMSLAHGGHLTHGSQFHQSGKYYQIVSYEADLKTGKLNYDAILSLALEHKPKMIIAGYSSYPWAPDWKKFRKIADKVGAILLADIAHPAGMVIAGVYPTPVGYADVVTFTTHKTLCGPRGAVILTFNPDLAEKIDNAVFPGIQGGPHTNKFAAIAVAFKIAQTKEFCQLQRQIVKNAQVLASNLEALGLKLAYNGTDTHLLVIDLNAIPSKAGFPLKGEIAARILDLCDIVTNKNTIPEDEDISQASGLRLGTPWITQQGMGPKEMEKIAKLIHQVLTSIHPFRYLGRDKDLPRGKIDLEIMKEVKAKATELTGTKKEKTKGNTLEVSGKKALAFLQEVGTANLMNLKIGQSIKSNLLDQNGELVDKVLIKRLSPDELRRDCYRVITHPVKTEKVRIWFEGLSDGYIFFDSDDIFRKVQGPVKIENVGVGSFRGIGLSYLGCEAKPYFIGQKVLQYPKVYSSKKEFHYKEKELPDRITCLYDQHQKLGARMITFAGWGIPLCYGQTREEHQLVRKNSGLFDVSHMGILEIQGEGANRFLDLVTTNYVPGLKIGQSHYSYLLDPDGRVIDDIMVYCLARDRYMIVVNAVNEALVIAWLEAVKSKKFLIDRASSSKEIDAVAVIKDLKNFKSQKEQKVDIALQGPNSLAILQALTLTNNKCLRRKLTNVRKFEFIKAKLKGIEMIISRTGYTGEEIGFEFFLHPSEAPRFWNLVLKTGKNWGLVPVGLGARDSLRTEAGLPLHGNELAGKFNISPLEAGFGAFVKLHKPFFIGRSAMIKNDATRDMEIVRFRLNDKGGRMIRTGNPAVSIKGECIGFVTSCALVGKFQQGMAYIKKGLTQEGEKIGIFTLPRGERVSGEKSTADLSIGDKITLHREAVVLSRFPTKE